MKKSILLSLFVAICFMGNAQQNKLKVIPFYENDSGDIYGVLDVLNIEINKFKLSKDFFNHSVNIVIDEYTKGKFKEVYNSKIKNSKLLQYATAINDSLRNDLFEIRLYSRKIDTILKLSIRLVDLGLSNTLTLKRDKSYSFKDVYDLEKDKHKIVLSEKFPVLTYTQPVGKKAQLRKYDNADDVAEFCGISGERIPFKNWYNELGIEHFFIFSIIVEKL